MLIVSRFGLNFYYFGGHKKVDVCRFWWFMIMDSLYIKGLITEASGRTGFQMLN